MGEIGFNLRQNVNNLMMFVEHKPFYFIYRECNIDSTVLTLEVPDTGNSNFICANIERLLPEESLKKAIWFGIC